MSEKHLSREQLMAFRDGALEDVGALEHLAGCSECQQAFDDSRWYLALARLRRDGVVGEHPDPDELAGYSTHALGHHRSREVSLHLRSCDRCLALYRRLRESEAHLAYSTPPRELLRATQRRFRSRPKIRNLGALVMKAIGENLFVHHLPDMSLHAAGAEASFSRAQLDMDFMKEPPAKSEPPETTDPEDEALPRLHERRSQPLLQYRLAQEDAAAAGPPPETFTVVEAGPLAMIFDAGRRDGQPVISVLVLDQRSGEPRPGLAVVIESESGQREDAVTRPDRAVTLPLPRGDSTLLIRDRETYKLTLSF